MKIIHCSDLHLGSSLSSLPKAIRGKRKTDILNSLSRMIEYAHDNAVSIIIFAGDVFDKDQPFNKDKTFFYNAIKANPEIKFFYLKGNHDILESYTEKIDNLFLFDKEWVTYHIDDISITGIELSNMNHKSLYSTLNLKKEDWNIVVMHGDIDTKGKDYIDINKLADKNIDYLALGHIHQAKEKKIDSRGIAVYSGCLEGRGFDEIGMKGFYLLDIENHLMKKEFIPFSSKQIYEREIFIDDAHSLYDAQNMIRNQLKDIDENNIIKIILKGEIDFDSSDIVDFMENSLENYFYVKVENQLHQKIHIEQYENELSLRGEFIRVIQSSDLEEKEEILRVGLSFLNGNGVKR